MSASGGMKALWMAIGVWTGISSAAEPQVAACPPGEPIQWIADYCMATIGTDDEIAASDCISRESVSTFTSACAAKLHFKRALCKTVIDHGTRKRTVDECVKDPAFMGYTVRNKGVGGR